MTVVTQGFLECSRAFGRINKEFPRALGKKLREAAEPVAQDATRRASSTIRRLPPGDPWTAMRTGGGTRVVYVVPRKKGRPSNPRKRRPKFGVLMTNRVLEPALVANRDVVRRKVDDALSATIRDWGARG